MSHSKGDRERCDIRLPTSLFKKISNEAKAKGIDRNTYINQCLEAAVKAQEVKSNA
jgi:predicted DNA binding CopG/RHH family protein